ncbi:MAG: hypothetical protein IKQ41_12550 [Clostridia bacterium]|nr:hypothetical protein [Clostridia bacterium]
MPGDRGYEKLTVNKAVWRALRKRFDEITTVGFVLVLIRVAMLSPLLLTQMPIGLRLIVLCSVYIALVMPLRYWGREKIRRIFYTRNQPSRAKQPYTRWMHCGLLRLGRGLLWGLPFLAGLGYILIGKSTLPYNEMWEPFRPLARLIGKEPDTATGILVGLALLCVFALLFAYGWWRDLPFEFLPVRSLGRKHTLHWSRRIMKKYRGRVIRATLFNILLCLPALIGYGAILVPYVMKNVNFSLSKDLVLNLTLRLLKTPLPAAQLWALGAVTLALYLPLCGIRKMRLAALIARLMRDTGPQHHASEEAAASPAPEETSEETREETSEETREEDHAAG